MSAVFIPIRHFESSTIVCTLRTKQDNKIYVSITCDRDGPDPEFLEPASLSNDTDQSLDAGAERVMVDGDLRDDENDEDVAGDDVV